MPNSFCTPAPMNTIPVTNRRTAGPNLSFRQTCSSPAFSTNWGHLRKQITKLSYKSGADSAHVEANEFGEITVALVFHLLLDADLRRVIGLHDARLQPGEEDLFGLLRLSLVLRHPSQNRQPLGGGRLGVQGLADANRSANGCRRSKLDQFAPAQVEIRVAGHHRFPFMSSVVRYSDDRHASAMIVHVGFWHEALTWLLPSTTN